MLSMAVNISGRQIHLANLCKTVGVALELSKLTPACLELELTESELMEDAEGIIGLLRHLKAMGVTTGYLVLSLAFHPMPYTAEIQLLGPTSAHQP